MKQQQTLLACGIALLLAVIFCAYLRPEFILDLANRYILC